MDEFRIGIGIHSDPDTTVVAVSAPGGLPELLTEWRELPGDLMTRLQAELHRRDPEWAVGAIQISGADITRVQRVLADSPCKPTPLAERGKLLASLHCNCLQNPAPGPIAVLVVDASMQQVVFTGICAERLANDWEIKFKDQQKAEHAPLHVAARMLAARLNSNQVRVNVEPMGGAWGANSVLDLMRSPEVFGELRKLHAQLSELFPSGRAASDLPYRFTWWADVENDVESRRRQVGTAATTASDVVARSALVGLVEAPLHVLWVGAESDYCLFRDQVERTLAPLARGAVQHITLPDSEPSPSHRLAFSAAQAASASLLGARQRHSFTVEVGCFDETDHQGLDPTWHALLEQGALPLVGQVRLKRVVPAGAKGSAQLPLIPLRITRAGQSWNFDWEIQGLLPGQSCDVKACIDATRVLELQAIGVETSKSVGRWRVPLRHDMLVAGAVP